MSADREALPDQEASAVMEAWQDNGISERDTLLAAERVMAKERAERDRLRAENETLKEEQVAFVRALEDAQCLNERLREAIAKAPHPLHCAASSPMWPGPCSCWKSGAASDEGGAS